MNFTEISLNRQSCRSYDENRPVEAEKLNAIMEELGYPIPQKTQEAETPKKAVPRTQPEKSSPGRENGSKQRAGTSTDEKPSVRGRLAALEAASKGMDRPKIPVREPTR